MPGSNCSCSCGAPRITRKKLAVAAVFAMLSELCDLPREWDVSFFDVSAQAPQGHDFANLLSLLFAVLAVLLAGLTTYKQGWIALKNRVLNINALMSAAVTGAVLIGQYAEAAAVMVLFALAEAVETKVLDKARDAVKSLLALTPETASVLRPDGSLSETNIRLVAVGSLVRVKPGERVALDGIVVRGQSAVNQAPITGESLPVEKTCGDPVYAGTINTSGSFEFEVSAEAGNSTLARIIHAVEEAQKNRAPIQRLVDLFAARYTPTVFAAAVVTALLPPLCMDASWSASVYTALVLLVISCPCALVISTPVSIAGGLAAAARSGILIKGGVFLEQGRRLTCLALDKTGTLTHGKARLIDFAAVGDLDGDAAFSLAGSLAACSDHPVSTAVAEAAAEKNLPSAIVDNFTAVPGRGVHGIINGQTWFFGNRRMMEELGMPSPALKEHIIALEKQGKSVVILLNEHGAQALFAVADTLKESSIAAVGELKRLGVATVMLTGDNTHVARAVAEQAGVDSFKSDLLPEDKSAAVKKLAEGGLTGMAGDGINDAPALAAADIGFAVASNGTDTAVEAADVVLMDNDLRKIPRFIRLSKAVYTILMQNIALTLVIKTFFLALTFSGRASMWTAVFADMGTSLLVVANGLRAMKK